MSITGIGTGSLLTYSAQELQSKRQQFQQEFQQLGEDLQSGNLSSAQSDFAALQQNLPSSSSASSSQNSGSSLAQAFNQLASDLQSGNLSATQSDYSTIQQDFQSMAAQQPSVQEHHHHHHSDNSESSQISQLFTQLSSALQSGNLTSAQQLYTTLQQDLTGSASNSATTPVNSQSTGSVSFTA